MEKVLIFGSENCPSWERTRQVIDRLRKDDEVSATLKLLDPEENEERFRQLGLTICPSMVVGEEVISVGPPTYDYVKREILKRIQPES